MQIVFLVPERTPLNVHFKAPSASYTEMFEQLERHKVISTRGLKPDAVKYGELIFDVNSAYFYNHGGFIGIGIELLCKFIAAMVVEISGVYIENQLTVFDARHYCSMLYT